MKQQLKEQEAETAKFKAIAEPTKARFKKGNHFSAEVDLAIVCLQSRLRETLRPALLHLNPSTPTPFTTSVRASPASNRSHVHVSSGHATPADVRM